MTSLPRAMLALASALCALVFAGAAQAQECSGTPTGARLDVYVEGVSAAKGNIGVTIYPDSRFRWLAPGGSLKVVFEPAEAPTTHICLWLPEPGFYAIAVYHDANGNRRFDHTAIFPQEGYAFSNNARAVIALPSFASARFEAGAETTQRIQLKYPN